MIKSKIDSLNPTQKYLLQYAAVIGTQFSLQILFALIPDFDKSNLQYCESLELVVAHPTEKNTWKFTTSLIQDTIYNMMLFTEKRPIHAQVGNYYLREHSDPNYYSLIAHHLKLAEAPESKKFLYLCGVEALRNYANKEAIQFFRDALEITQKIDKLDVDFCLACRKNIGIAYMNLEKLTEAIQNFEIGLSLVGITIPHDPKHLKNRPAKSRKSKTLQPSFSNLDVLDILLQLVFVSYANGSSKTLNYILNLTFNFMSFKGTKDINFTSMVIKLYALAAVNAIIQGNGPEKAKEYLRESENLMIKIKRSLSSVEEKSLAAVLEKFSGMYLPQKTCFFILSYQSSHKQLPSFC